MSRGTKPIPNIYQFTDDSLLCCQVIVELGMQNIMATLAKLVWEINAK